MNDQSEHKDLTAFNLADLGITTTDDDVHIVSSGRPYTTVAKDGDSRLMMAAGIEAVGVPVKNMPGKKWLALAVVIRFIVKGPDAWKQLPSRNLDSEYHAENQKITYKDKITVPFCVHGNPIYSLRIFKEKDVEETILANLTARVPAADPAIMRSLLETLFAGVDEEDPIVVEVIG